MEVYGKMVMECIKMAGGSKWRYMGRWLWSV